MDPISLRILTVFVVLITADVSSVLALPQIAVAERRALLISCDGLRPDAITPERTPIMTRLIATGSYQDSNLAELPAITLTNHSSMVTGLRSLSHGIFVNTDQPGRIKNPTIFDVAKWAGLPVGFFANKSKLGYLCEDGTVDVWNITNDVDVLAQSVTDTIAQHDLRLTFVHFGEPDGAGHREGWMSSAYLEQVARVDAAIGRILEALKSKGTLDETLVLVTADHGGSGHSHFMNTKEDRHIPFILNGPGVAEGYQLCRQIRQMDAAATVLDFLGLPTATAADGYAVSEAFESQNCPSPIRHTDPFLLTASCAPMSAGLMGFPILMASIQQDGKARNLYLKLVARTRDSDQTDSQ